MWEHFQAQQLEVWIHLRVLEAVNDLWKYCGWERATAIGKNSVNQLTAISKVSQRFTACPMVI